MRADSRCHADHLLSIEIGHRGLEPTLSFTVSFLFFVCFLFVVLLPRRFVPSWSAANFNQRNDLESPSCIAVTFLNKIKFLERIKLSCAEKGAKMDILVWSFTILGVIYCKCFDISQNGDSAPHRIHICKTDWFIINSMFLTSWNVLMFCIFYLGYRYVRNSFKWSPKSLISVKLYLNLVESKNIAKSFHWQLI